MSEKESFYKKIARQNVRSNARESTSSEIMMKYNKKLFSSMKGMLFFCGAAM
jgi:hypothetical protein